MNKILLVFAVMCAMEQLTPVSSAPTNHTIDVLKTAVKQAVASLNQTILLLELRHMVRYVATCLKYKVVPCKIQIIAT